MYYHLFGNLDLSCAHKPYKPLSFTRSLTPDPNCYLREGIKLYPDTDIHLAMDYTVRTDTYQWILIQWAEQRDLLNI